MLVVAPASAHIALPEQLISRFTAMQGDPRLAAIGSRVFGVWLGAEGPDRTSLGYGYSLDGGASWVNEIGIPEVSPPLDRVVPPGNVSWSGPNSVHIMTDFQTLQHFTGTLGPVVVWSGATEVFSGIVPNLEGFDVTAIAADASAHAVYAIATEGLQPPSPPILYRVLFRRSLDDGVSWQPAIQLSSTESNGGSIVVGPGGIIHVSWVDYALGQVLLRSSTDHGASFGPPVVVSTILDNLAATTIGWRESFIKAHRSYPYYNYPSQFTPNFPALAIDNGPGPNRGALYLTWAENAPGLVGPASTFVDDRSGNDAFATAQPVTIDCDINGFTPTLEFGNFDIDNYRFDAVAGQSIWISGSATASGRSDGGTSWRLYQTLPDGQPQEIYSNAIFDPAASPAIWNPKPAIITLPNTGRYYIQLYSNLSNVSYRVNLRSYTPTPGAVARDMRDIVLVRSSDGGRTWSPKVRVNHDAAGWDQAMPNVAVDGLGRVYVAWYDRRGFATGDSVHAYAAVSTDAGQSFGQDLRLSAVPSGWVGTDGLDFPGDRPGGMVGDRIGIAAGDNYGIVAWTDMREWPVDSDVLAARIVDVPTATEAVSEFSAEPSARGVRLSWLVNDARRVSGLLAYRSEQGGAELALGAGLPTPSDGRTEYVDDTAEPGHTYEYRLRVTTSSGLRWLGPVTVTAPARITALAWRTAWPNPFARRTSVRLAVPRTAVGAVRVYDVQGKQVATLAEGVFEPGERTLEWDGRDGSGGQAAPGIYFLTARVGSEHAQMRVARVE